MRMIVTSSVIFLKLIGDPRAGCRAIIIAGLYHIIYESDDTAPVVSILLIGPRDNLHDRHRRRVR